MCDPEEQEHPGEHELGFLTVGEQSDGSGENPKRRLSPLRTGLGGELVFR